MKLEELQIVDEGLRSAATAGLLSMLLAFSNAGAAEVYVYTDDDGQHQVVTSYDQVPEGKMARVIELEDMDVEDIQRQIRAQWKTKDLVHRGPSPKAPRDRLSRHMYRTDI